MVKSGTTRWALIGIGIVWLVGVVIAALVVVVVVLVSGDDSDRDVLAEDSSLIDNSSLERFYNQELVWEDCGVDECTTLEVPLDYSDPDGETIELSLRKASASDDAERVLFINPGGPGGSGVDYLSHIASEIDPEVHEMYDIIGFDPRGVHRSTPLECLSDEEFIEFLAEGGLVEDLSDLEEGVEEMREFGEACVANSGDLARFISTIDVAHDLDLMRVVFRQEKLDYYGASYGTQIGATYAELYPERSGRLVLDAAVLLNGDPLEISLGQTRGFQRAFVAFAEWCLGAGNCDLGDSVSEIEDAVSDFIDSRADEPWDFGGNRPLTHSEAIYGVIMPLYAEFAWPFLRDGLEDAIHDGDGSEIQRFADIYLDRRGDTFTNNSSQVIYAVRCLDREGIRPLEDQLAEAPQFEAISPVFGKYLAWDTTCMEWPVESPHERLEFSAAGADPIVVIGTTRDPATPYEWAVDMVQQLEPAVLISRDGDGHGGYMQDNDCVDEAVNRFLLEGVVPEDGLECAA